MQTISEHAGSDLARIRVGAELKQSTLAKAAGLDTSRLSRIESGEIVPTESEIAQIARAIDTPLAQAYIAHRQHSWALLTEPSFWNPDREALAVADTWLERLNSLSEPSTDSHVAAQADLYRSSLNDAARFLARLDHAIAFVGEIGVGKSAGICGLTDLLLPTEAGVANVLSKRTVLEVAAGRTTLCEIGIRTGPENHFGVSTTPHSHDEVFRTASDFCASVFDLYSGTESGNNPSQTRGVPEEVARALRNMSGLMRTTSKDQEGKTVRLDPMIALIEAANGSLPEVTAEVLRLMRIEQRTSTEFSYKDDDLARGLTWLREHFSLINKGQHAEVTLPKRIDLTVPLGLLNASPLQIGIVDTKGVDDTALRPDIRQHLDDPRKITVLCSRFNSAPDDSVRETLESLVETGGQRAVSERTAVLVLARSNEVLDTQDDEGKRAESSEEGYQLKSDQVKSALAKIKGAERVPIHFYDVLQDNPDSVRRALVEQVKTVRARYARQIHDAGHAVSTFLDTRQKKDTQTAHAEIGRRIRVFIDQYSRLPSRIQSPKALFMSTLGTKHARTVWATTRRNGTWSGLNAYHLIGLGNAGDAQRRSQPVFEAFDKLLTGLLSEPQFNVAHDYIVELQRAVISWKERLVSDASGNGREISRAVLFDDNPLWNECERLWEQGRGFRSSVYDRIDNWFGAHPTLFELVDKRMAEAWKTSFIAPLTELVGPDDDQIKRADG